jgi:hypothetical protein
LGILNYCLSSVNAEHPSLLYLIDVEIVFLLSDRKNQRKLEGKRVEEGLICSIYMLFLIVSFQKLMFKLEPSDHLPIPAYFSSPHLTSRVHFPRTTGNSPTTPSWGSYFNFLCFQKLNFLLLLLQPFVYAT